MKRNAIAVDCTETRAFFSNPYGKSQFCIKGATFTDDEKRQSVFLSKVLWAVAEVEYEVLGMTDKEVREFIKRRDLIGGKVFRE